MGSGPLRRWTRSLRHDPRTRGAGLPGRRTSGHEARSGPPCPGLEPAPDQPSYGDVGDDEPPWPPARCYPGWAHGAGLDVDVRCRVDLPWPEPCPRDAVLTSRHETRADVPRPSTSPVIDADGLRRLLAGHTPVSDDEGNVRVEIIRGRGRRNQVLWVPLEEAARLLALHGDRAALLTLDTSTGGIP